ncbi:TadE/TadG family type IV pilus assembly protein [Neorhizobium sp. AL 9.2.2]|uniref:TadE/TadG family type IV pilus assembly protein n=1 Tax=Neorhizobium sp. AL 9.2.2 TaxID=2712894 RepID=UPI001573E0C9|nr:TadE/TadG family type IV pilus assembly protein [Neorhizobium sp. AL 9.2.2]NSY20044.1 pilus assembly protein [Neorhizobium sp. AL 9.2.2]
MTIRNILQDRGGNFGMITALVATPLIIAAGGAIDYTLATREKVSAQGVADSAALAGARVFNGTNAGAAKVAAERFLAGYAKSLPAGMTYNVSMTGQTVLVTVSGSSQNAFLGMVGLKTIPIGVAASAIAPMKPKSVTFTPKQAQGFWYKKVSILVTRAGSSAEQAIGTVIYQPKTQQNSGQGDMTISPGEEFELGKYSKLVLQMEVKQDGCPLEYKAKVHPNKDVFCEKLGKGQAGYTASLKYDTVLRTDDPNTSHYLFVDKVQMPKNASSPLDKILECDQKVNHAWEDGGGFERQDFFYTAASVCAPDGEFVRLTK